MQRRRIGGLGGRREPSQRCCRQNGREHRRRPKRGKPHAALASAAQT
jgi:hypothetical protein